VESSAIENLSLNKEHIFLAIGTYFSKISDTKLYLSTPKEARSAHTLCCATCSCLIVPFTGGCGAGRSLEFQLKNESLNGMIRVLNEEMNKALDSDASARHAKMLPTFMRGLPDGSETGDFLKLHLGGPTFCVLPITLHGTNFVMTIEVKMTRLVSERVLTAYAFTQLTRRSSTLSGLARLSGHRLKQNVPG